MNPPLTEQGPCGNSRVWPRHLHHAETSIILAANERDINKPKCRGFEARLRNRWAHKRRAEPVAQPATLLPQQEEVLSRLFSLAAEVRRRGGASPERSDRSDRRCIKPDILREDGREEPCRCAVASRLLITASMLVLTMPFGTVGAAFADPAEPSC